MRQPCLQRKHRTGKDGNSLSFALEVKNQLDHIELKQDCCRTAEYDAMRMMAGSMLETFSPDYRNRAVFLCEKVQRVSPLVRTRVEKDGKQACYLVSFPDYRPEIGLDTVKECCKKAFLRGCFRVSGTVNAPDKAAHLEISFSSPEPFLLCRHFWEAFGISGKSMMRGTKQVLYVKDASSVSLLLALMGANKGMLDLETMRVEKEIRNNANRAANCDSANIQKANDASYKQILAIRTLKQNGRFAELPESLQEIADLRLAYPEENLTELGMMLHPPLSKAGVSHRMKKILQFAEGEETSIRGS